MAKFKFINDSSRSTNLSPKKKFTFVNDSSRSNNISAKKTVLKNPQIVNKTIGSAQLSKKSSLNGGGGNPCHDAEGKFC